MSTSASENAQSAVESSIQPSKHFASYTTWSDDNFVPYSRDYLLDRASDLFVRKNKTILPNLDSTRLNRKTYISNVQAICEKVNRSPEDFRLFFSTELRISTSFKDDGSLKLDQLFNPKNLATVYHNFLKSIQCTACKSINTVERKENRITFLECQECRRSVALVKK